jgi:hypothetical protein
MINNAGPWLTRAKSMLEERHLPSEDIQFAVSLLAAIYGAQSPQSNAFNTGLAQIAKSAENVTDAVFHQQSHAHGTIRNTVAEIEGGLITSLRTQVAGEIFAELVGLGKEILEDDVESAKNVSAVCKRSPEAVLTKSGVCYVA